MHQLDWNRSSGRTPLYLYRYRAHLLMKLELWYYVCTMLASVKRGWETLGEVFASLMPLETYNISVKLSITISKTDTP